MYPLSKQNNYSPTTRCPNSFCQGLFPPAVPTLINDTNGFNRHQISSRSRHKLEQFCTGEKTLHLTTRTTSFALCVLLAKFKIPHRVFAATLSFSTSAAAACTWRWLTQLSWRSASSGSRPPVSWIQPRPLAGRSRHSIFQRITQNSNGFPIE